MECRKVKKILALSLLITLASAAPGRSQETSDVARLTSAVVSTRLHPEPKSPTAWLRISSAERTVLVAQVQIILGPDTTSRKTFWPEELAVADISETLNRTDLPTLDKLPK